MTGSALNLPAGRSNASHDPSEAEWGCWPTPEQELLLRAALLPEADARSAWTELTRSANLATLGLSSRRLFPLVYRNLRSHGVDDPSIGRLKEAFARTFFENQLLFESGTEVLRSLADAGIPTMVLKGAALVESYYGDSGLRPMQDFDVMVPRARVFEAMRHLGERGWRGTYHAAPEQRVAVTRSVPYANLRRHQLDLHWHLLSNCWNADRDEGFWARAIPFTFGGVRTSRLCPTDQLLHVCAHGILWDDPPPIRWIADAYTILRSSGHAIDWDALVGQVEYHHLALPLTEGFTYLRDRFDATIPDSVMTRLSDLRVAPLERFVYAIETGPNRRLSISEFARVLYLDYLRVGSSERGIRHLTTFARRTADRWPDVPAWQLPVQLPFRLLRRVVRRVVNRRRTFAAAD